MSVASIKWCSHVKSGLQYEAEDARENASEDAE